MSLPVFPPLPPGVTYTPSVLPVSNGMQIAQTNPAGLSGTSDPEMDFLRFAYNLLDVNTRVAIQKRYLPNIPPFSYYIFLCQLCFEVPTQFFCSVCTQSICYKCMRFCKLEGKALCLKHHKACPFCKFNCSCQNCRKYFTSICEICSENYQLSYSCGCVTEYRDRCVFCDNIIDPATHQRVVKMD